MSGRKRAFAFTLAFKLKLVQIYLQNCASINELSRTYHIERKVIRYWIRNAQKIHESRYRTKRSRVRRPASPRYPELEDKLIATSGLELDEKLKGLVPAKME